MKGLLEVEPLHFTCHAASDGTKMEKLEAGNFCSCKISSDHFFYCLIYFSLKNEFSLN